MADNRRDFQRLARMRLADARALIRNRNFEAAYYLTGLAVECAVKACIAKNRLIGAAKLQAALETEIRSNISFKNKWDVAKDWSVDSRYATGGLNARDLYRAVAGRDGIMQWLRQRW
jgi:HEPN domain